MIPFHIEPFNMWIYIYIYSFTKKPGRGYLDPKHKIKFWFRPYLPSLNSVFRLQRAIDKCLLPMMSRLLTII